MPLTTILVTSGVVAVFRLFGVVLAWGDRKTRNLHRETPADKIDSEDQFRKAA